MEDRALIEYACLAAGMTGWLYGYRMLDDRSYEYGMTKDGILWNPLTDDGDALRLAIKLNIDIMFFKGFQEVLCCGQGDIDSNTIEPYGDDIDASTRKAIVRCAAAEIGRAIQ